MVKTRTVKPAVVALLAVFALVWTAFANAVPHAAAATLSAPGATVTLTDSSGNTFNYSLTTVSDGTGQGTSAGCYINTANGYTPGDNTPTDGYVCVGDEVEYRVDWNANIVTNGATVNFTFNNVNTTNPYKGWTDIMTRAPSVWNWSGGVTGGSGQGFVGSGNINTAQMVFNQTGPLSGYWTFLMSPSYNNPTMNNNGGIIDLAANTTFGSASGSADNSRPVTALVATRVDVTTTNVAWDNYITTVGSIGYRGATVQTNAGSVNSNNIQDPNYGTQGYWPGIGALNAFNAMDTADTTAQYSMLNADPNTLVSVNGGTPVAPSWNGTTAYVTASLADKVKFLVPWSTLANGTYTDTFRVDLTSVFNDKNGVPTLNGAPDPGVGLPCSTTTANLIPGSLAGTNQPNNNCYASVIKKVGYGGGLKKTDRANNLTLGDGTTVTKAVRATSTDTTGVWGYYVDLYAEPVAGANDQAICATWNSQQQRLISTGGTGIPSGYPIIANNAGDFRNSYPNAVVYYSTQNLSPAGAPNASTDVPNCGSPSDTSTWTTTAPTTQTGWDAVQAVMIVFPGAGALLQPATISLVMAAAPSANFTNLVTPNVRNYMGMTGDSTVANPTWAGSSDAVSVVKSSLVSYVSYEANTGLGVGAVTYTTQDSLGPLYYGADPGGPVDYHIYLDNCMLNASVDLNAAKTNRYVSATVVGAPDPNAGCGLSSTYYVDVQVTALGAATNAYNPPPLLITWTAPITSQPGDQYQTSTVPQQPAQPAQWAWTNTSATTVTHTYTVLPTSTVTAAKQSNNALVQVNDPYSDTISWMNYTATSAGSTQFIDVLPYNGDTNGTVMHGTDPLSSIVYSGKAGTEASTYEYTKTNPATINNDPADASNQAGGSTVWCTGLSGGNCPANLAEVTALRFTTANFDANVAQFYTLNFAPTGNQDGDIYYNQLSQGVASGLGQPIPAPAKVQTAVGASTLPVFVYNDANRDGSFDNNEQPVAGYTVSLKLADGTTATAVTDSNGVATFTNLHSQVVDPSIQLASPWTQITQAGTSSNPAAGDAGAVTIDPYTVEPQVNFGLVLAPTVTVTKITDQGCPAGQPTPCPLPGAAFMLQQKQTDGTWSQVSGGVVPDPNNPAQFTLPTLMYGDYRLIETQAPSGYELSAQPYEFTISVNGLTMVSGNATAGGTVDQPTLTVADQPHNLGNLLPKTGGDGIDQTGVLAALTLLGAGCGWLLTRRKK